MTLLAGTRLGTYQILGPLGVGGMGEVYRAKGLRCGKGIPDFLQTRKPPSR